MSHWSYDAVFYHIYPLGLTGAPARNDFHSPAVHRLDQVHGWLDHVQSLGVNALYIGPLFESTSHGYDTVDFYHVDRRLGDNHTLARLSDALHARGMRLILDAVFNHVGRDFWAFYDLRQKGQSSDYVDWFHNLTFNGRSPYGDPFTYEGWQDHYSLVKLNLHNPAVRQHIFDAVESWIDRFNIDGLRLDAADCIDLDFFRALSAFTHARRSDFWLVGEIIHGDYRQWANGDALHSVTNYEAYKGLWSSLNDANYHEIAYTLNRQFGEGGLYRHLPLYNFVDNHDVDRVASRLNDAQHLYPLYCMLFTMPGVPSIYYGSEWGLKGARTEFSDKALRPALTLEGMSANGHNHHLPDVIAQLARLRQTTPALRYGGYRQLHTAPHQIVYLRHTSGQQVVVAINAADQPAPLPVDLPFGGPARDLLNDDTWGTGDTPPPVPAHWARVITSANG